VYYNPAHPAGYGSIKKLERALPDIEPSVIREWITYQDTITRHKRRKIKFPRLRIKVYTIDQQWQADLCDMKKYKTDNDGYKWLMTMIDCFSKYAWAVPLYSKEADEIIRGLTIIFKKGRKPRKFQSDKGTEFKNAKVKAFLKKEGVKFFTADNPDIKAAIAENFNGTLKTKMWKHFTHKKTTRYVDVLDDLVTAYNNTEHSSTKKIPSQVKLSDTMEVYANLYGKDIEEQKKKPPLVYKFKEGDHVRILKEKTKFEKG